MWANLGLGCFFFNLGAKMDANPFVDTTRRKFTVLYEEHRDECPWDFTRVQAFGFNLEKGL